MRWFRRAVAPANRPVVQPDAPTPAPAAPDQPETLAAAPACCPYCGVVLEKVPARSGKCPACGQRVHVRSLPLDGRNIIVKEDDLVFVRAEQSVQRAIKSGIIAAQSDFDRMRIDLRRRQRREPSAADVRWGVMNAQLMEHSRSGLWGLYRNTRLTMADQLLAERRTDEALRTYLEVCYLDLNGPMNTGNDTDPGLRSILKPFSASNGDLAGAPIGMLIVIAQLQQRQTESLEPLFMEVAARAQGDLRLPVKPETAWRKLAKEIVVRQKRMQSN